MEKGEKEEKEEEVGGGGEAITCTLQCTYASPLLLSYPRTAAHSMWTEYHMHLYVPV